jgi:hypothetical protein
MAVSVSDVLSYAEEQLGKPYVFGAAGPGTFDCSGLVTYVFRKFGVNLPHHAADQAKLGTEVSKTAIAPGDLVFSDWGDGPDSHVGIAVTPGKIIDAPHTGAVVRYDDLSSGYLSHVTHIRRMPQLDQSTGTGGGGGTTTPIKLPSPPDLSGPLTSGLVGPLTDIASALTQSEALAQQAMNLFMPSNFLRLAAGVAGVTAILFGLYFIAQEIRHTGG